VGQWTRIAFVGCWVRRAGSGYLFILAADADAWANHYFLNEMCFPKILEPIKQHLKIIKIRTIHIWTFSIWITYQ
jgi:hypothetical protein